MRPLLSRTICLILALVMSLVPLSFYSAADENDYDMAYNLYANPVTSGTSGTFITYMIDFRSDSAPDYTYWAVANYNVYLGARQTTRTYRNISGAGGYAGLQAGTWSAKKVDGEYFYNADGSRYFGKAGIQSIWEMTYRQDGKEVKMNAERMYPSYPEFPGRESTFTGEGDGANNIAPFAWENDRWYTVVLHSWEDAQTGTTFFGEWFRDCETGKWTLFSYFDSKVFKSCYQGGMGLFMENFSRVSKTAVRTFNTKNLYALDFRDNEWKSLNKCEISYGDGGTANKGGRHEFGATDEYFWGLTGGTVDNQKDYDAKSTKKSTYTIDQPAQPTFDKPAVTDLALQTSGEDRTLVWTVPETAAPQISYELEVFGTDGISLFKASETRPEVRSCALDGVDTDAVKCVMTVTDIFGGKATAEYTTKAYDEFFAPDDPTPEPSEPATPTPLPGDETGGETIAKLVLIFAAIGTAVLAVTAAVVVTVVLIVKKKKK